MLVNCPTTVIPLKPFRALPVLKVKFPVCVNVPLPVKVPVTDILLVIVGLLPSGSVQLLFTILVPTVCVNVTRLNVALLQLRVPAEVVLKFSVPPLALNVPPEIVKLLANDIVPVGAVNDPPLNVAILLTLATV